MEDKAEERPLPVPLVRCHMPERAGEYEDSAGVGEAARTRAPVAIDCGEEEKR